MTSEQLHEQIEIADAARRHAQKVGTDLVTEKRALQAALIASASAMCREANELKAELEAVRRECEEYKGDWQVMQGFLKEFQCTPSMMASKVDIIQAALDAEREKVKVLDRDNKALKQLFNENPSALWSQLATLKALVGALPVVDGEINEVTACLAVRGHRVTYAMIRDFLICRATLAAQDAGKVAGNG